jgi:hypothetical protein
MSKNGSMPDKSETEFDDLDDMPSAITHLPVATQVWATLMHRSVKTLMATHQGLDGRLGVMEDLLSKMLFLLRVVIYGAPGLASVVLAIWWLYAHFTVRP